MPLRLAILVSGRGSNMNAILDAIEQGKLDAEVAVVFSNNADALALRNAEKRGIKTASLSHKGIPREHHERQVLQILQECGHIDYVILAGYMRILSWNFLHAFKDDSKDIYKVINIHPSLLPAFPGAHGYEDAFDYGVRVAGITVHLVDEKVDHGPILAQETFSRLDDDDIETFKARGLALEHQLFPKVLQDIASNGIKILSSKRKDSAATSGGVANKSTNETASKKLMEVQ